MCFVSAAFKSFAVLCFSFPAFFYPVQMSRYFKKRKKIRKEVLQGGKTQGLPFRDAKSHTVGISGSTPHHPHLPNSVSADARNSFNRGQHVAWPSWRGS